MRSFIKLIILSVILSSCGGGGGSSTPEKELGAFNLVFPDNNHVCTAGTDVGADEVAIEFLWTASDNATSYTLEITNQESGDKITQTSNTAEESVVLAKGVQFSWTVTAKFEDKSKKSSSWNFYSEGVAQDNYAPFPAEIKVTDNGDETVKINWEGSDLDNDIVSYDIHFGTTEDPALVHTAENDSEALTQSIVYGTDYYIKIVTVDELDNKSIAEEIINF